MAREGMTLLEEACHYRVGFEVSEAQTSLSVSFSSCCLQYRSSARTSGGLYVPG